MSEFFTTKKPPACMPGFEHVNRFWDGSRQTFMAKITPGEFYVTSQDELIGTVLGSCVSACIRDNLLCIGGMNHFMLPSHDDIDHLALGDSAARYGSFAMEQLINNILRMGGHRDRLEVKITGGGRIMTDMGDIGASNIHFVKDFLKAEGLTCVAEDLGGAHPRKVLYDPKTGSLKVKKLQQLQNATLVEREQAYEESLRKQQPQGDVELF